jgi:hypothetical protein
MPSQSTLFTNFTEQSKVFLEDCDFPSMKFNNLIFTESQFLVLFG